MTVIATIKQTVSTLGAMIALSPPTLLELDSARNRKVCGLFFAQEEETEVRPLLVLEERN
jgi:hypothetical protein